MKTFVFLALCGAAFEVGYGNGTQRLLKLQTPLKPSVCYQPKDAGPCFGHFLRYYYNTTTNTCEQFIFGGCKGNANHFLTLERCESKCGNVSLTDQLTRYKLITKLALLDPVCELPKQDGPCYAYLRRYYYNTTTDTCEKFIYGGCQGNANNFETLKECETRCGGNYTVEDQSWKKHIMKPVALQDVIRTNPILSRDAGFFGLSIKEASSGPTGSPRIEQEVPTDRKFGPRNTDGDLRSSTRVPTDRKLGAEDIDGGVRARTIGANRILWPDMHHSTASESFNPQVGLNPVCNETLYPGPCAGYFPRYYYNNVTKACERFVYGGCRGNGNNFVTLEECKDTCWEYLDQSSQKIVSAFDVPLLALALPEVCTYPAETGPCEAAMSRYFYNTTTETCEVFTYGGCHGNGNRFRTYCDCERKCMTHVAVVPRA